MVTKHQIDDQIRDIDPGVFETKTDRGQLLSYQVLLAAANLGPFTTKEDAVEKIKSFLETKDDNIRTMFNRLVDNDIVLVGQDKFLDPEIYGDGFGLALGACVASGWIDRVKKAS